VVGYSGGSGGISEVYYTNSKKRTRVYQGANMHAVVERFVAVLDDFTILFLQDCRHCHAIILFEDQGHSCEGVADVSEVPREEAKSYVRLMKRVKKIYTVPTFDAPRE
jgi:hypothetical protein